MPAQRLILLPPESASVGRREAQPSSEASESRRTLLAESGNGGAGAAGPNRVHPSR
ncbi:hypothetical protein [Escherichia coli]|uniref:hypothetical protein n=1 Tax=Escherichia coli TaxID=562 RepID=UPI002FCD07E2